MHTRAFRCDDACGMILYARSPLVELVAGWSPLVELFVIWLSCARSRVADSLYRVYHCIHKTVAA